MGLDIIIPTKNKTEYLFACLDSIRDKTKTEHHIYIADTGSDESEFDSIVDYIKTHYSESKNVTLLRYDFYNFARINNHVAAIHATNDTFLFCNNDIELIDNCVDAMYGELQKHKQTGTVGCRLLFDDGTVQHAGQIAFTHRPKDWPVPHDKLEVTHRGLRQSKRYKSREQVMGNTAALMMVRRDVFGEAEGFNERYIECFEDVEFNMRVMLAGYRNMYLDRVSATHHESVSRTRSHQAIQRLETDYIQTLYPFWCGLNTTVQNKLTNFSH